MPDHRNPRAPAVLCTGGVRGRADTEAFFRSKTPENIPDILMYASFKIRQLRYAIAAGNRGSFYRAAAALEIDQSAVSRATMPAPMTRSSMSVGCGWRRRCRV